jgi:hypothetical protein
LGDRDLTDIFAVQDEITEAVTIAVAPATRALNKTPCASRRRALTHGLHISGDCGTWEG